MIESGFILFTNTVLSECLSSPTIYRNVITPQTELQLIDLFKFGRKRRVGFSAERLSPGVGKGGYAPAQSISHDAVKKIRDQDIAP